jgi:hypothetical protein
MAGDEIRLLKLEKAVGYDFPPDYRSFLLTYTEDPERPEQVVSSNPDYWGVRSIFELGEGADYLQADEIYRLTGDVLPDGAVPIADDSSGNLYLLDCRTGAGCGSVCWWDHEQDLGEDRIEVVARSFATFLASLRPDPDG